MEIEDTKIAMNHFQRGIKPTGTGSTILVLTVFSVTGRENEETSSYDQII